MDDDDDDDDADDDGYDDDDDDDNNDRGDGGDGDYDGDDDHECLMFLNITSYSFHPCAGLTIQVPGHNDNQCWLNDCSILAGP